MALNEKYGILYLFNTLDQVYGEKTVYSGTLIKRFSMKHIHKTHYGFSRNDYVPQQNTDKKVLNETLVPEHPLVNVDAHLNNSINSRMLD